MFNSVTLIGFLGKDPEVRYVGNGTMVVRLSLATTERFTERNGEKREETFWHNLIAWGKLGELANQYLRKGSRLMVEGKLTYRDWEDKQGQKRTSTEIVLRKMVFLDSKKAGSESGGEYEDVPF